MSFCCRGTCSPRTWWRRGSSTRWPTRSMRCACARIRTSSISTSTPDRIRARRPSGAPSPFMQRIYAFQHVWCEDLGTLAPAFERRGMHITYVRLFEGAPLPPDVAEARALVFLGGPMSVNDEKQYDYLRVEKRIIADAIDRGQAVLGICLGSQLIAAAAGARVYPAARPELGWDPISLTVEGRNDPVLAGVAAAGAVFHWHGETFDLPAHAVRLAFSPLTLNQAFR